MQKLFVGNLSYQTTESEIRSIFERYGPVSAVRIMSDRASGRPCGFAFVVMPRLDDADEAIVHLNGVMLGGRQIRVHEAENRILSSAPRPQSRWHLV